MDRDRLKEAGIEAVHGELIRWFQEHRIAIASMILDLVPDAHAHSAASIARFLPRMAQVFKIATPAGIVFDPLDDIVQELAQALKEEAGRRAHGASETTTVVDHIAAGPKVNLADQAGRFVIEAARLEQAQADALLAWYDALGDEDRERLYFLCSQADDAKLAALLKRPLSAVKAAVARTQLPKKDQKPKTFLEFRGEVSADGPLNLRVNSFLAAKGVTPVRFWRSVEKQYGGRIRDKKEFALLMNLGDDEIFAFLHLAETMKDILRPVAGFGGGFRRGAHAAGLGIGLGARAAGEGIGDASRVVGDAIVAAGRAVRDTAVATDDQLRILGLGLQARYPAPPPVQPSRAWAKFMSYIK